MKNTTSTLRIKNAFVLPALFLLIAVPMIVFAKPVSGKIYDTVNDNVNQKPDDSTQFATVYIYREANSVGGLVGYKIMVNDSAVWKLKNNTKVAIRLYKEGPTVLSINGEDKKMNMNVQFGQSYYIKFVMISGLVGAHPEINLIGAEQGQQEYAAIKEKKKKNTDE